MPLPSNTFERIKNEAKLYEETEPFTGSRKGYIAGATAENERAQGLADALEAFVQYQGALMPSWPIVANARKALQQWKDGKGKEACIEKEKTFEYEIRHINNYNSEMKVINEMVGKGYRLVAVSPYCSGNSMYFERMEQQADKPTDPCPHCGKELSRDRNLCCRECGKEVERGK